MVIAAAATAATSGKRVKEHHVSSKYKYLQQEKHELEIELTTKFPLEKDILFDKDLELLMMNGYVHAHSFEYAIMYLMQPLRP